MDNKQVAHIFAEIADLLEITGAKDAGRHLLPDTASASAELVGYLRERATVDDLRALLRRNRKGD